MNEKDILDRSLIINNLIINLYYIYFCCRYFGTAQIMLNGFLQSQGIPKTALFDPSRPSETISNLVDHVSRHHLNTKIASITYVKPAVNYVKDILKLGKARGLLQKFNATELSDKLTDTVNLEVSGSFVCLS